MRKSKFFIGRLLFAISGIVLSGMASGQDKLSLEDAVGLALKNNFSITIARNESEINSNNMTRGNAGMLPQVGLFANGNLANNSTNQHYSSNLDVKKSGVGSNSLNAGVSLNWTLFDGMKMFATYDKLKELNDRGIASAKIEMENNIAAVTASYYNVVQQKQLVRTIEESIGIYNERIQIAQAKLNIGNGSYVDVLQARVDLNEQKSALFKQKSAVDNAKNALNALLSRDVNIAFDVDTVITVNYHPGYEDLKGTVLKNNSNMMLANKNSAIANYSLRETQALRYPRFGLVTNYNFTRSENQAGFILLNQNLGFNAGFVSTWSLFDGWNTNRQIKNAKINVMSADLATRQTQNTIESALLSSFNNLQSAMERLKLEEENTILAKEYAEIALEKFRLGDLNSLELKVAQQSLLDAETRLVSARYDAKLSETELKKLNGELVK